MRVGGGGGLLGEKLDNEAKCPSLKWKWAKVHGSVWSSSPRLMWDGGGCSAGPMDTESPKG